MAAPTRAPRSNCKVRVCACSFPWPGAQVERWLTDVLQQATYVINLPIAKRRVQARVSLGFKNHFGSLNDLGGPLEDNPHSYIDPTTAYYNPAYQPAVDICANANIAGKTVLTIGDALFGAPSVACPTAPVANLRATIAFEQPVIQPRSGCHRLCAV